MILYDLAITCYILEIVEESSLLFVSVTRTRRKSHGRNVFEQRKTMTNLQKTVHPSIRLAGNLSACPSITRKFKISDTKLESLKTGKDFLYIFLVPRSMVR